MIRPLTGEALAAAFELDYDLAAYTAWQANEVVARNRLVLDVHEIANLLHAALRTTSRIAPASITQRKIAPYADVLFQTRTWSRDGVLIVDQADRRVLVGNGLEDVYRFAAKRGARPLDFWWHTTGMPPRDVYRAHARKLNIGDDARFEECWPIAVAEVLPTWLYRMDIQFELRPVLHGQLWYLTTRLPEHYELATMYAKLNRDFTPIETASTQIVVDAGPEHGTLYEIERMVEALPAWIQARYADGHPPPAPHVWEQLLDCLDVPQGDWRRYPDPLGYTPR